MKVFDKVKKIDYLALFARIAVAMSFLSAAADRFGWWTPLLGAENVTWVIWRISRLTPEF